MRRKGLEFDLVLWNEEPSSYLHELHESLSAMARESDSRDLIDKPGGIFVRKAAYALDEDKTLVQAAAAVVLVGARGLLAVQLDRLERTAPLPSPHVASGVAGGHAASDLATPADLAFFNGLGGFTQGGREYAIVVRPTKTVDVRRNGKTLLGPVAHPILPPAPWSNVIANSAFGCLTTEAGTLATWAGNSQANRLTPWTNDPASDPSVEAVYLRDETTGEAWCPTPRPMPSTATTVVRHGAGYTTYETNHRGLALEWTVFVPVDDPVKLMRLKVRNLDSSPRKLSATYYAEWVLGTTRESTAMHVVTEVDTETGALLARNRFREGSGDRVAFADVDRRPRTLTADRMEFLGRNGDPSAPAAMRPAGPFRARRRGDRPVRRDPGGLRTPGGRRVRNRIPAGPSREP